MNGKRNFREIVSVCLLGALLGLLNLTCAQYEYSSPLPGLIDIRLHTITDTTKISFSALNSFVLTVTQIEALRADGARGEVFADLQAINHKPVNYNTLDPRAQDSSLVIGQAYLPPGDYIGVLMLVTPSDQVLLDGYRNIHLDIPPEFSLSKSALTFREAFHISEEHTTRLVLTIDLNTSLVEKVHNYAWNPHYHISSILYE